MTMTNDVMIFYGFMDDYQRRDSRYVVTDNEEGRCSQSIYTFETKGQYDVYFFQVFRVMDYGLKLRSEHTLLKIDTRTYHNEIKHIWLPMTERFCDAWNDEMVPIKMRVLINELGLEILFQPAPFGWPRLHLVNKQGELLGPDNSHDVFGRPF